MGGPGGKSKGGGGGGGGFSNGGGGGFNGRADFGANSNGNRGGPDDGGSWRSDPVPGPFGSRSAAPGPSAVNGHAGGAWGRGGVAEKVEEARHAATIPAWGADEKQGYREPTAGGRDAPRNGNQIMRNGNAGHASGPNGNDRNGSWRDSDNGHSGRGGVAERSPQTAQYGNQDARAGDGYGRDSTNGQNGRGGARGYNGASNNNGVQEYASSYDARGYEQSGSRGGGGYESASRAQQAYSGEKENGSWRGSNTVAHEKPVQNGSWRDSEKTPSREDWSGYEKPVQNGSWRNDASGGGKDNGAERPGGKSSSKAGGKGDKAGKGGDRGSDQASGDKGGKSKGDKAGKGSDKAGKGSDKADSHDRGGAKGSSKGEKGKKGGKGSSKDDSEDNHQEVKQSGAMKKSGGSGAVSGKHLSEKRFPDLPISKETKRGLAEGFGYEFMTEVQAATCEHMVAGYDVVARAKTGTGKTIAFMVPIIECIKDYPAGAGGNIQALILSPTRELAVQIMEEGKVLLQFHRQLGISCFYGGTNIKGDHNELRNKAVDILVATPGRMQDHLDNTPNFLQRIGQLCFLCLDEADQLLDMGFRDAILKIIRAMPPAHKRQGALFSATYPASVSEIAKLALRPDHKWIDTVRAEDEVTPDQIEQCVVMTDIDNMMETLWNAVNFEINKYPKHHKIMVFFVTARLTQFYAEAFVKAGQPVLEIHSRKSQPHRTKCGDQFRNGTSGIVFSSDVSARGLDYPDVTAVIQVGIPSSRDQYIHRLGRTGRAGKSGRCILLLQDFEAFFLRSVKDLPVQRLNGTRDFPGVKAAPNALWAPPIPKTGGQAYQAWLGYYNSVKGLSMAKESLIQEANRFAASICALDRDGNPPPILRKTVGKMGLKGVHGLNIVTVLPYGDD